MTPDDLARLAEAAIAPKRRKKPKALTPMSVKELETRGYIVAKIEQRIPHCFITRDAFGVFDLLAASRGGGIVGVQVTSGANGAARRDKILAEPQARTWIESGGRILLHLWAKRNGRTAGARKAYSLVEEEIVLADFPTAAAHATFSASPAAS